MQFYSRQSTDMRASPLIGANVTNMANETVGEINELILDKDGKVAAVVVGVGGFLGIGEREVALGYKSLNIKYDPNAMTNAGATTIQVNATKDSQLPASCESLGQQLLTQEIDTSPAAIAPRNTIGAVSSSEATYLEHFPRSIGLSLRLRKAPTTTKGRSVVGCTRHSNVSGAAWSLGWKSPTHGLILGQPLPRWQLPGPRSPAT